MNAVRKSTLRVLIADDVALARRRLEDLMAGDASVEVVASVRDGEAAVRAIRELSPDLVFLDVQMPGMSGIDVARELGAERMPLTIFVTAYDAYAVRAFELAAVDYLVKPFDDERALQSLARARRILELRRLGAAAQPLRELLERTPALRASGFHERLAVEGHGKVRVIAVADIDYITASGHYAELHIGDKSYLLRERMEHLEARLDPARFVRIHRSTIVSIDRIAFLLRGGAGDYSVQLRSEVKLSVSRGRVTTLERLIGLPAAHTS